MIGSSSARIKEVVEVFREPLLGHGLLGELDISLCNEVVVGLITCGGLLLGQGAKLLSGSARACYPRREEQEDKRDEEKGDEVRDHSLCA